MILPQTPGSLVAGMTTRFTTSLRWHVLDSAYVGLAISGLAYNPDTLHLFVMVNYDNEHVYVLDAANNYQLIGQFYIDGWPKLL